MSVVKLADAGISAPKYRRTVVPSSGVVVPPDPDPAPEVEPWVRPADWLTLPAVNPGDQTFVGLHEVFDHDSNFVAFLVTGAYTVDWGDGTPTEDFASGVQANHKYAFSALSPSTLTSGGYRQAIVTVTMQSGQTFTGLNIALKHSQVGLGAYSTGWLDIRMAGASVTALTVGANSPVTQRGLQQFEYVGNSSITSCSQKFISCRALSSVIGTAWTAAVTTFGSMFDSCNSLRTIPLLNTAAGTIFASMFNACNSLQTIPLLNTAAGTNFATMFQGCYSLRTIPLLNTANGTNFSGMFTSCYSLQAIPLLDTAKGTTFASMFFNCYSLRTIPFLNTANGTTFSAMFYTCSSLQTIPLLDTAKGTVFSNMFLNCSTLQTIPLLNTALGTTFFAMFSGCFSLQTVPLLNTALPSSFSAFDSMFAGCVSLSAGALSGTRATISYTGCRFSATELNRIYANLASGVTGQTITVTTNYGNTADDPTIATAKGWTVTG